MTDGLLIEIVKALLFAVVGGGGVGTVIAWRKDRREVPVDKADAMQRLMDLAQSASVTAVEAVSRAAKAQVAAAEAVSEATAARAETEHVRRELEKVKHREGRALALLARLYRGVADGKIPPIPDDMASGIKDLGL